MHPKLCGAEGGGGRCRLRLRGRERLERSGVDAARDHQSGGRGGVRLGGPDRRRRRDEDRGSGQSEPVGAPRSSSSAPAGAPEETCRWPALTSQSLRPSSAASQPAGPCGVTGVRIPYRHRPFRRPRRFRRRLREDEEGDTAEVRVDRKEQPRSEENAASEPKRLREVST